MLKVGVALAVVMFALVGCASYGQPVDSNIAAPTDTPVQTQSMGNYY